MISILTDCFLEFAILAFYIGLPWTLLADEKPQPSDAKPAPAPANLNVEVTVDPPDRKISDARVILVKITTSWAGELEHVTFEPGTELAGARPDWAVGLEGKIDDAKLSSNVENIVEIHLPASKWIMPLFNLNFLYFRPDDYPFTLKIDAKVLDGDVDIKKSYNKQAHFTASAASVILGGVFGAFILNSFSILGRLRREPKVFDWRAALRNMVVVMACGGIAAGIIIYLGNLTDTVKLGVTITATSFEGGVIIGLFTNPIMDRLSKFLSLQKIGDKGGVGEKAGESMKQAPSAATSRKIRRNTRRAKKKRGGNQRASDGKPP